MGSLPNLHELSGDGSGVASLPLPLPPLQNPAMATATPPPAAHRPLAPSASDGCNRAERIYPRGGGAHSVSHWDDSQSNTFNYSPFTWSRHSRQQVGASSSAVRRRESLSSSAGASSVKRLIDVVRSTPSRLGPVYSRRVLCRNFAALCVSHAVFSLALLPLLALQSSVTAWWSSSHSPVSGKALGGVTGAGAGTAAGSIALSPTPNPEYRPLQLDNADNGSLLFAILFGVAAASSIASPGIVTKLGPSWTLVLGYFQVCIFFAAHLYPTAYTLVPTYIIAGLALGPVSAARISCLMTLAAKLAFVLTEAEEVEAEEEEEEVGGGRTEIIVRRLARGLHAAADTGLVAGSLLSAFLLWFSLPFPDEDSASLDTMFLQDDTGERVCGASACPVSIIAAAAVAAAAAAVSGDTNTDEDWMPRLARNFTAHEGREEVLPARSTILLAAVYLGFSILGLVLTAAFLDHIKVVSYPESSHTPRLTVAVRYVLSCFRDPRLQLAAPLSVFIGLEQGFMYADFSKSYVVCSLGLRNVFVVLITMGLMQAVAAWTLSMLLQHIRRYVAITVGFVFHSCLILVLLLWTPSGDDEALFYVISAAWGVCHAIWETLYFTLLVRVYPDSWQAPFAHSNLFRFLGLALALALHGSVCNWLKLYALSGALILAVAPYAWLEIRLETRRRAKHIGAPS